MIAVPTVGLPPLPELKLVAASVADAPTNGFAAIMQSVAPVARGVDVNPDQSGSPVLPIADVGLPETVEFTSESGQHDVPIGKTDTGQPYATAERIPADCVETVFQTGCLPSSVPATGNPADPRPLRIAAPQQVAVASEVQAVEELVDRDQPSLETKGEPIVPSDPIEHLIAEPLTPPSNAEKPAPAIQVTAPSPERIIVADAPVVKLVISLDRVEVPVPASAPADTRGPPSISSVAVEKLQSLIAERNPSFTPQLMQTARDVMAITQDRDIRFNVRPDVLGPVAVTIERTEAGSNLRLGVETQAAVQAVRHAEPLLNDARGYGAFTQVTVDLSAPDQRGRRAHVPEHVRRISDQTREILTERAPAAAGRFA